MSAAPQAAALDAFERERPRLVSIARRMLGSVAEAEDVVQSAWLRYAATDPATIIEPAAWLTRTVSRLAIDVLRSARVKREVYVGPWLPEPVVEDEPDAEATLTTALLLALERLSPLERAAFLLHDVFAMPFEDVAAALDRDPAACRQLATRARKHVADARPRFTVPPKRGREIAEAFLAATRSGDAAALGQLLTQDVRLVADGGGIRPAATVPVVGRDHVIAFFTGYARKAGGLMPNVVRVGLIDGLPGIVTREADGLLQTTAVEIDQAGAIRAIYVVRNPEKLRHLEAAAPR